jgi:hypothetical protein
MDAPLLYKPHPSLFPVMLLGGFTGTVLLTALLRLLAGIGVGVADVPLLLGGPFSSDAGTVFAVGHALFVVAGVFVLPLGLGLLWAVTPGDRFTFGGALVKGALWGVFLFVVVGILLPLLGLISKSTDVGASNPGPFGLGLGLSGPVQLLLGTQVYSLTSAVVAAMPRGLQPLDAVGWAWWSHGSGESP